MLYRCKAVALPGSLLEQDIFCVITTYPSLSENSPLQRKGYGSLTSLEIISLPLGFGIEQVKMSSAMFMK